MEIKNIHKKLFVFLPVAVMVFLAKFFAQTVKVFASSDLSIRSSEAIYSGNANDIYTNDVFMSYAINLFWALIFWTISPVGILFFLASIILLSAASSCLMRKIAWVLQIIAFLLWLSIISLILIAYIDSILFNILHLGGKALNVALLSGFVFAIIMFIFVTIEKRQGMKKMGNKTTNKNKSKVENESRDYDYKYEKEDVIEGEVIKENKTDYKKKSKDKTKYNESIKFAKAYFSDIKNKIRRKIKEDLKEIVDEEIEKRL